VESAVGIFIFLMLLLGVFDLSLGLYTYHYISDAAREGSRWAMVRGNMSCSNTPNLSDCDATGDEVAAYVKDIGYPGIDASDYMTVSTTWLNKNTYDGTTGQTWSSCGTTDTCKAPGNQVQVTVTYNFPLSLPYLFKNGLQVSSTSAMVIAQ
jgi:Flp pilus assembly protein TadG